MIINSNKRISGEVMHFVDAKGVLSARNGIDPFKIINSKTKSVPKRYAFTNTRQRS